jgi:hypothetical protein
VPDWVSQHRTSITYIVSIVVGLFLVGWGVVVRNEPAMVALGAGAIGLPGFKMATEEAPK